MKKRILIKIGLIKMRVLIGMGALVGIGVLINKKTFEGGAYSKGAVIGRRALNQIITVH